LKIENTILLLNFLNLNIDFCMKTPSPAIWLIILIVGLPQLCETVYTPSLPDIAKALQTSEAMAEYTLTIYLLGFAIGTLFWGKISDEFGRKPCVIAGLLIFIAGSISCYFSTSIEMLMLSRLAQAFGGSTGSVLGQAICRDAFHGPALSKLYSSIGSTLAIFPAIGPLCGGIIAEVFGWRNIFISLALFAALIVFLVSAKLPETCPHAPHKQPSMLDIAKRLMLDKKVLGCGIIVAGCNGILFSYFAEAPFYLIKALGLSPTYYGASFLSIGSSAMLGGAISNKLHARHSSKEIMSYGLLIIAFATIIFSIIALTHHNLLPLPSNVMIGATIISQVICIFGTCIASVNAFALALTDYKYAIGTASSFFGFFYYCLIALFTFFMGLLHDGTLLPMPLYFLALSCLMLVVKRTMLGKN